MALKAQEEVPQRLRTICHELSMKVEQAVSSGIPYTQVLGNNIGDHVREYLNEDSC